MTAFGDLAAKVVPLAPASVLRTLGGAFDGRPGSERDRDLGALPVLTVHLTGGHAVTGVVVRLGTDRGSEVAVFACGDGRYRDRLAYVALDDVVAVTVLAPEVARDALTGGALPEPVTGEPVTRLGLRRAFAPTPELPLDVAWDGVPDSPEALANLQRLLTALTEAAGGVTADELGREAWARVATVRVEHSAGAALSVERTPAGVAVRADLTAALPRALTSDVGARLDASL